LLLAHRYTGLFLVTFLVVAGLTGSTLAFYHELDATLNPRLFKTNHPSGAKTIDPFLLREKLAETLGETPVHWMPLALEQDKAVAIWVEPKSTNEDDEYFFDPVTGDLLGSRRWGDLGHGVTLNLLPFLYRLHYSLALGETGALLFGIAALLWTMDCFVGAWLTFPAGRSAQSSQGRTTLAAWLRRWGAAWLIKGGALFRSIFSFHRAAGLWLWALLFVFAWSAVGFNLNRVFHPVMRQVFGMTDPSASLPDRESPLLHPALDWREAHQTARAAMTMESHDRGFQVTKEGFFQYLPDSGTYRYAVHSSLDLGDRFAGTRLWIDANDGRTLAFEAPTGIATGNTLASWLFALHMGTVGGTAYRVAVVLIGIAVSALSLSGVWIWWRKRSVKRNSHSKRGNRSTLVS
jgi:uncharacterized iron-regulated membrane protein